MEIQDLPFKCFQTKFLFVVKFFQLCSMSESFSYKILGKNPFVLRENYIKLSQPWKIVQILMCLNKYEEHL